MKFTYDKPEEETREVVAYTFKLSGMEDQIGLCIKGKFGDTFWIYPNGLLQHRDKDLGYWKPEDDLTVKRFYRGDSVTITF